jgi:hypothetical protein
MATPWPQVAAWPNDIREHATSTITHQQIATLSQETNKTVKDAAEERRTTTALIQKRNDIAKATNDIVKAIQSAPS